MSTLNAASADIEAAAAATVSVAVEVPEAGGSTSVRRQRRRRRRRRPRPSVAASSETTTDGSFRFSDSEEDNRSLHSQLGGSNDEYNSFSTETEGISVVSDSRRHSSRRGSCTFSDDEEEEEVDLERGELEMKVHNREKRRECRICHLSLSVMGRGNSGDHSVIELGCCCKGDLGSAHKQCAETWFKIKGNTTCEICGSAAVNIAGEQPNEAPNGASSAPAASVAPLVFNETRNFWHGRRVMNFLLACMIFAFIISWLFHFKILP